MVNRITKNVLIGIAIILCITILYFSFATDHTPPDIHISDEVMTYTQGEDTKGLLAGVTAKDKKDGDVTASVIVESITILENQTKARVSYVAKDTKNNVNRGYRDITYVQKNNSTTLNQETQSNQPTAEITTVSSETPVIIMQSEEVTILKGSTFTATNYILKITDDKDTSTTLMRRVAVSGTVDTSKVGDYKVEFTCTDSNNNKSETKQLTVRVVE